MLLLIMEPTEEMKREYQDECEAIDRSNRMLSQVIGGSLAGFLVLVLVAMFL